MPKAKPLLLLTLIPARAHDECVISSVITHNDMWYYYGNGLGWGMGGAILMGLFWILVILVVIWLVRGSRDDHRRDHRDMRDREEGPRSSAALDILNERYAKGELTKEEYEARKRDIMA